MTKPFFLDFCTGACHSPHQAPRDWIERYRGHFDRGWDAWRTETLARQIAAGILPPGRSSRRARDWVPPWDALSADERRVYARFMEAFAGFLSHTDHHLGRLLAFLEQTGDLDNTLVMVVSDNGASSEGGPHGSLNDAAPVESHPRTRSKRSSRGWTRSAGRVATTTIRGAGRCAGNTPFRRWKREVHEGGVADPLIVHWPAGIAARGELRRQYVHAIDIAPTVLEALGVAPPDEHRRRRAAPVEGDELRLQPRRCRTRRTRHETQYYEMFGSRAVYHRGWKAVTYRPIQDLSSFEATGGSSTTYGTIPPNAVTSPPRIPRPSAT